MGAARETTSGAGIEELVREVHAMNRAWKAARERFGEATGLAVGLRDLKTAVQRRLLREHAGRWRLVATGGGIAGIELVEPVEGHRDACHIPAELLPERLRAGLQAAPASEGDARLLTDPDILAPGDGRPEGGGR